MSPLTNSPSLFAFLSYLSLSPGNIPEIYVRPAGPKDYDGVMAIIPDLWGGTDHLPLNYHSFFNDPQAHPFVGEVDGKLVCFKTVGSKNWCVLKVGSKV